jgi:transcriptional regulator with XRE-family HTH domain
MILTGEQIRAARAMLRMEQATLAEKAGVSVDTVKRLEGVDGPPKAQPSTLQAIREVFELSGLDLEGGGVRPAMDRNARVIDALVNELDGLVRANLEFMAKRNTHLFDQGVTHTTDLLVGLLAPSRLEKMVKRVLPKEKLAKRPTKLID